MSRSKTSGCTRKAGNKEMATSTQEDIDLNSSVFDLGRSFTMADIRSSSRISACRILGLAGELYNMYSGTNLKSRLLHF